MLKIFMLIILKDPAIIQKSNNNRYWWSIDDTMLANYKKPWPFIQISSNEQKLMENKKIQRGLKQHSSIFVT
jgi:hypothetical protein